MATGRRALIAGAALLPALHLRRAAAANPIRIGVPLELSGRFVAFGAAGRRGIELAHEAFRGEAGGRKVELLIRDIQSDAQTAVAVINELTAQGGVKYMIGPVASVMFAAVIPAWRQEKPVWIGTGSVTTLTEEQVGRERRFFHTYPYSYHYHETMAAALKASIGDRAKKTVIVFADDAYGRNSLPFARRYYTEAGFQVVGEELIRTAAADYNPLLSRVRRLRPDLLVALVQTTDLATLAKQINIAGLEVPYLADGTDVLLEEWQRAVGPAQEGWIGLTGYLHGVQRPASRQRPDIFPSQTEWEGRFRERYGIEPTFLDVMAYCSMAMLMLALEKTADDPDKVVEELERIDMDTLLGRGHFAPTSGGTLHQAFEVMQVAQRQSNRSVLVYPPEVQTGDLRPRGRP
jgi:branched-chain amino acid transport system substrate-binding protein